MVASTPESRDPDFWADKRARQADFLARCQAAGLTPQQTNQAASIFPPQARLRVLRWPKL